jgi:hypothetical protein
MFGSVKGSRQDATDEDARGPIGEEGRQLPCIAKSGHEPMPFGVCMLAVVWVLVPDCGEGVIDAEATDGGRRLNGNWKLSGNVPGSLFSAGDDKSFIGCKLHLQGVRDVVLHLFCGGDQLVRALVNVAGRGSDTQVVYVEAYDQGRVGLGKSVHYGLKGSP